MPGRFRYQFNSITAAATFHGSVATLNVRNGTGSELGAPALYIVSSDDRRYDGVARGAEPIPDGEQVTLEFTFPGTVGPETIGLAVLAFGDENVRCPRSRGPADPGVAPGAAGLTRGRPRGVHSRQQPEGRPPVLRTARLVLVSCLALAVLGARPASVGLAGDRVAVTVKTRMTGWASKSRGYHVYRRGATARLDVGVWAGVPARAGEGAARMATPGPWLAPARRLVRQAESRQSRPVQGPQDLQGVRVPIRVRIRPTDKHRAGRSPWSYSAPAERHGGWASAPAGGLAVRSLPPGQHEQQIAQPVQVAAHLGVHVSIRASSCTTARSARRIVPRARSSAALAGLAPAR